MRLFVRVIERGSFSAEAQEAVIGQSAASNQIAILEAQLGAQSDAPHPRASPTPAKFSTNPCCGWSTNSTRRNPWLAAGSPRRLA